MRIVVIDDDPLIVMALETILGAGGEAVICGSGHSGEEAEKNTRSSVGSADGYPHGGHGRAGSAGAYPETVSWARILLLTTFLDDEYIIRAIRAGPGAIC